MLGHASMEWVMGHCVHRFYFMTNVCYLSITISLWVLHCFHFTFKE